MEKEERGEEITPEEEAQMAERFQILMMNPMCGTLFRPSTR